MAIQKILVGAHNTPEGEAALRRAIMTARAEGAELHLVGFVPPPKSDAATEEYEQHVNERLDEVTSLVESLAAEDLVIRAHVPKGVTRPAEAILRVASQEGVDEIIIGLRRRSRVGKLVLGSNAQDILLGAECTVVAVKVPVSE